MISKKVLFLTTFLWLWLTSGCYLSKSNSADSIPLSITPFLTPTLLTQQENISVLTPTPEPKVSQTPASSNIVRKCPEEIPLDDGNIMSYGSLLFRNNDADGWKIYTLHHLSLKPMVIVDGWRNTRTSPYNGSIAWLDDNNSVTILHASGKELSIGIDEIVPGGEERIILRGFLSEESLFIEIYKKGSEEYKFYILSSVSGNIEPQSVTLPNLYYLDRFSVVSINPITNRILYTRQMPTNSNQEVILLDIKSGDELWAHDSFWDSATTPPGLDWQLDGSHVVITGVSLAKETILGSPELLKVSIDGNVTQLTFFNDFFDEPYNFGIPSWSPDARYIAFHLMTDIFSSKSGSLHILDTKTGETTDYCLPISDTPRWSPTGNQLAFSTPDRDQLVVLDIIGGRIQVLYTAADNREILLDGWIPEK